MLRNLWIRKRKKYILSAFVNIPPITSEDSVTLSCTAETSYVNFKVFVLNESNVAKSSQSEFEALASLFSISYKHVNEFLPILAVQKNRTIYPFAS
jgi:hypothetical protein